MKLYKPPNEKRDYFRVTGKGPLAARLWLDGGDEAIPLRDVSAGGFSYVLGPGQGDLAPYQGGVLRGQLMLDMEDYPLPVAVDVEFSVVKHNSCIHCRIIRLEPGGRDLLYTYVFEQDRRQRLARQPLWPL